MKIAVFCGASIPHDNDKIVHTARQLGQAIAKRGDTLVYGGSNLGLMGVVSGAALEAGGNVVGVIPTFFSEEIIMSQPVTELIRVSSMAERKEHILRICDAFIALPGGIGTLDEVLEVMVANQLSLMQDAHGKSVAEGKPMILCNLDGFFDPFISQIDSMGTHGFFRKGKRPPLINAHNVEEVMLKL